MIERRLVGRRFIDFHSEAAHPLYPNELERRLAKRRDGDREGAPNSADVLFPGRRRRPPILWTGIARCASCERELRRARNLSSDGRKYFIAEYFLNDRAPRCDCQADREANCKAGCTRARVHIEWIAQSGTE